MAIQLRSLIDVNNFTLKFKIMAEIVHKLIQRLEYENKWEF